MVQVSARVSTLVQGVLIIIRITDMIRNNCQKQFVQVAGLTISSSCSGDEAENAPKSYKGEDMMLV